MRTSIKPAALLLTPSHARSHTRSNAQTVGQGPVRRTPTRSTFPSDSTTNTLRIPVIDSPLPSPSLPSIVPRHGKRTSPRWRRRIKRLLCWFALTTVVFWVCLSVLHRESVYSSSEQHDGDVSSLPSIPGPMQVADRRGRSKWTVYIPDTGFPLPPGEYARIVAESMSISQTLRPGKYTFLSKDASYVDIHDAQQQNLLPPQTSPSLSSDHIVSSAIYSSSPVSLPPCTSSLTFLLQTPSAALGPTLLALWLSYGFAQRTNRAFFIDDTNWAYGDYMTYFRAPPMPACRPAPVSQRVPWPVSAKHLVVSEETAGVVFGDEFHEYYQGRKKKNGAERKPVFDMLRAGYDALFHLTGDDKRYLEKRVQNLRNDVDNGDNSMIVGIHIRRGENHPFEFQYRESYIPLDTYLQTAEDILPSSPSSHSKILLASDDPDVYHSPDLTSSTQFYTTHKAQRYISLASKSSLDSSTDPSNPNPTLDNTTGWEGGFFTPLFWSLGSTPQPQDASRRSPSDGPAPSQYSATAPENAPSSSLSSRTRQADALHLRELVGRAYLLDLAVLGSVSDGVVCGASSAGCRILGVMMGWEGILNGEKQGRGESRESGWFSWGEKKKDKVWRNVDGGLDGWRGVIGSE